MRWCHVHVKHVCQILNPHFSSYLSILVKIIIFKYLSFSKIKKDLIIFFDYTICTLINILLRYKNLRDQNKYKGNLV